MEKLFEFVKTRRLSMLLVWVVLIIMLYTLFAKIIFFAQITLMQILFVIGISILVYLSIVITAEYIESRKKLLWVSSIYDQFVHMQIFLDDNNIVLEVLEGESEKLEKLATIRNFKTEKISNKRDLVKILVK